MNHIAGEILASFRAGILAVRMDGVVLHINPIGNKILDGFTIREGENLHLRAGENSFFRILSEALTMNYLPTRLEVDLPGKEGERQFLGFTLAELKEDGKKAGVCAFFKDLTHVEMAEESENLKHRLLLLGQMAAGLAHEIRNPIASIGVHCGILRDHLANNEKLEPSVRMIASEINRVEYIIRECLNFVRPAELGIRPVEIKDLLAGVIKRAQSLHPGMQYLFNKSKTGDLIAEADRGLMEQAIANILLNAAEACGGGGRVEIAVGTTRHYSESTKVSRQVETLLSGHPGDERDYVRISILDNGPGMPSEIQDRIFAPFFTTKKTGTGIGLPMAQKIIHTHGGVIDLRSTPGKGTEFIIKIPMRQKSVG